MNYAPGDPRVDRRRCDPQARPSTSFVSNVIKLPWSFKSTVLDKVPGGSTLIFGA